MNNQHAVPIKANRLAQAVTLALGFAILPTLSQARDWNVLGTYNSSDGRPNGMSQSTAQIPSDIITRVNRLLGSEGKNISSNPETRALLTDDLGGNLFLTKNANIKVVFLNEGAGYQNSVGFFKFNKADLPIPTIRDEKIIFANSSTPPLSFGDTVNLGNFSAGDAIGFTVVANGWSSSLAKVRPDRPASVIFRTVKGLNPETNPDKKAHTVLLSNPDNELLVLAMEDLNRENRTLNDFGYTSDDDFNDIIMAILVEPFDALDSDHIVDVDTGTTSENPTDPDGGGAGTTPLITGGDAGAGGRPIGVSGRQSWHEQSEERK